MNEDSKYFGALVNIFDEVIYVGDGENPKDDLFFQMWEKALKEIHGDKNQLRGI